MGRIGRVISYDVESRNDVQVGIVLVDMGGGENKNLDFYSACGDDSPPLPGDFVAMLSQPGTGRFVATSYIDKNNQHQSNIGEKRIYARDIGNQQLVCQIYMQNDGTIQLTNSNGSVSIAQNGSVNINGVVIDSSGNINLNNGVISNSSLPVLPGDLANKAYVDV